MTGIFKLPESGDEVTLTGNVLLDDDDYRRFVAAGGIIYTRGFCVEVRTNGGHGGVTFHKPQTGGAKSAWIHGAQHFKKLADDRADEGTSIQLACLVLAEHCTHESFQDERGGPTPQMVALAENTIGVQVDEVVADLLRKDTVP